MAHFHEILGYEVIATLGYGARSTIFAVQDRKGQVYALKRVVKQSESDQRFLDQAIMEHEVARRFDHGMLRRSFKLIKQRTFLRVSEVLVLMEMVDGLTLEQASLSDMARLVAICQQAATGLGAMHAAGYVHADIKPNNIMVTDAGSIKIIDFGQSCPIGTVKERIQGTPDYIAPEQVDRKTITAATDVFNLGATMYWLITRRHVPTKIPKGEPGQLRASGPRECPPPIDLNSSCPPALSSLVMQCVAEDPADRPASMSVVHDRLGLALAQIGNRSNGRRTSAEKRSATAG